MKGWVLDCYADMNANSMVLWVKTNRGVVRLEDPCFVPHFYVRAPHDRLVQLTRDLEKMDIRDVEMERRKVALGEREKEVLSVAVRHYSALHDLATTIDAWGDYHDFELYNVDLRMDQRYFLASGLFSMGLMDLGTRRCEDSQLRIDYPIPSFREARLAVKTDGQGVPALEDHLTSATLDDLVIDGSESDILEDIMSEVQKLDPDVLYTVKGDSFVMPFLAKRAAEHGMVLQLGREEGERCSKGKSYFTYGRIKYKPPAHKLRGRVHIDTESAFIHAESGMYGLIEISRLSMIPLQDLSRLSPGSAISAMQVNEAVRTGHLVRWKKNLPEEFKTAGTLIVSDRGGFIYEPKVGVHDHVAEVDFFSLYPSIMVHFNISPETLMCTCCPRSSRVVPEIGYWVCERRKGLIPSVLEPLLTRRRLYKQLKKEPGRKQEMYAQRAKALKWVLVTCFGYTGYRNARFGRIECHESINAYGRDILLRTADMAEKRGFEVLHGIVDSLWLHGEGRVAALCEEVSREIGIPLQLEGIYRWIVFLPNVSTGVGALNRYYGLLDDGTLKVRGVAIRRRDTPLLVEELQQEMLQHLSRASNAPAFLELVPSSLGIVDAYVDKVREGSVPREKLVMRRSISKHLEEYVQFNDSLAALRQMRDHGFELQPGQSVEYIITDAESKNSWDRVKLAPFLDGSESYDVERYVELVLRGASELLSPFGFPLDQLQQHDEVRSKKR